MIKIESALICFFDATELKIAPKILKVLEFTKNYFEAFCQFSIFLVSKILSKLKIKIKSLHGPQETPNPNFE
jgi:hypothetical protein